MRVDKRLDLNRLEAELIAASVPVSGLGFTPDDVGATSGELFTYAPDPDLGGMLGPAELPPEADPVVEAHVAPPLVYDYVDTAEVASRFTTTDASFHEVYRLATVAQTIYRATLSMEAIDTVSMDVKDAEARLVYKNTGAALVAVGSTIALGTAQDAAAAAWTIQAQVQGLDLVIGVRGAAGRGIDWVLQGSVVRFSPAGL